MEIKTLKKIHAIIIAMTIFCLIDFYCHMNLPVHLQKKSNTAPGVSIYLYYKFKVIYKGKIEVDPSVLKDYESMA